MKEQLKKAEERMNRRVDHMCQEFAEIRAGRANPAVLDKVKVDYYGAPTPVNQLAAVSVTEARTLIVQPWDASVLRQIEKAIQKSRLSPRKDVRASSRMCKKSPRRPRCRSETSDATPSKSSRR